MSMTEPSQANVFPRIERSGVAHDGIHLVKDLILRGDLVAGQRLPPERELAEMLGVSRPTLRESIRALIALNILDSRHGHGTYVTSLDPRLLAEPIDFILELHSESLRDLSEARRMIEPGIARLAAERITDDDLERLRDIVNARQRVDTAARPNSALAVELDLDFHRVVAEAAANTVLMTVLASVTAMGRASREKSWQLFQHDPRVGSRDLAAIFKAIESRDGPGAEAAMGAHVGRIADAMDEAAATEG